MYRYQNSAYKSSSEVKNALKEVLDILNDEDMLENISFEHLKQGVYRLEKSALSLRKALEKNSINNPKMWQKYDDLDTFLSKNVYDNLPVKVSFFDNTLKISTPLLFTNEKNSAKNLKQNYLIQDYIALAFDNYFQKNNDIFGKIKAPFCVLIKRFGTKFSPTKHTDNDNFEVGRVVNYITSKIGLSDNCNDCTTIFTFEKQNNDGMEFLIFPKGDLLKHLTIEVNNKNV